MIASTFINRPVTAIVISIVLVISGAICIVNLPVDQYPNITPPAVSISGQYAGADAETIEQTVAIPIEEQVNGVQGMEYMQSTSTNSGGVGLSVTFEIGTNVYIAALNVHNRVGIATPLLPSVVSRLGLTVRPRNPSILMVVAIYAPNNTHNITFLDNYTNKFIQDALLRVPGVGDITSRTDNFSMRVWLNPEKLAAYGLIPQDIINAIRQQNIQVAAGAVGAPPQPNTQTFEFTVLVNGLLTTPAEFEKIIVKTMPGTGELVYLKDVARVNLSKFTFSSNSFMDGKRSSYLLVYQAPGSNALETAKGVYNKLEQLKKSFPADVEYAVPFENITVIKVSMHEVIDTLLKALGLVALVVFFFLQNWRSSIIPIVAIPVSIFGTFCFFVPLGFTINTLTMFGFVLAIGIVVDDAIIVVEAVQHYIDEEGMTPREATYHAMKDISAPVIAIALILAAVFVPVGFIPGIVGRLYQQFAITIAISVVLSAFVALSLTPALCTILLKPADPNRKRNLVRRFFDRYDSWFKGVTGVYAKGVEHSIRGSKYIIILLVCICVGAYMMFRAKPSSFIPPEDDGRLFITYQMPEGFSTAQSVALIKQLMDIIGTTPGVAHYAALSGLNVISGGNSSNNGTIFCMLKPWDERKTPPLQVPGIIGVMQKRFAQAGIKNANIVVIAPPAIRGIGATAGFSIQIQQRDTKDDVHAFEKVVKKFVDEAHKNPATSTAFSFFSAHTPAFNMWVDREKCEKLGVNVTDVFNSMQAFMGSFFVNDFTLYDRPYHVVVQADTTFRALITDINKYYVRNAAGTMVPMSTLVSYAPIETAPLIQHFNLFRSAEVNGAIPPGFSSGQGIQALKDIAAKVLPQGYGYEFSGLSYEEIRAGKITFYIFLFSITFVFLFLAALYESWSVPFSVMLAVPISVFGAILTLTLVPTLTNNVYAQIGLITLIGLSAKNAILIVEFAKNRVDSGEELIGSTIEAVSLRFRPILMTSLAFILGVMPLVLATGAGAQARRTIGYTVLGGMLAATSLAIFIVPVLFVVITRTAYGKKRLQYLRDHREELLEKQKRVSAMDIDPELEYEMHKKS